MLDLMLACKQYSTILPFSKARSWATPVRRSHTAQHTPDDVIEFNQFKRNISGRRRISQEPSEDSKKDDKDAGPSLEQMITDYGFAPSDEPILKTFIEHHDDVREPPGIESSDSLLYKYYSHSYIGDSYGKANEECIQYTKPQDEFSDSPFRQEAFEEFKESLSTIAVNSDDVDGIRKVSNESGKL